MTPGPVTYQDTNGTLSLLTSQNPTPITGPTTSQIRSRVLGQVTTQDPIGTLSPVTFDDLTPTPTPSPTTNKVWT